MLSKLVRPSRFSAAFAVQVQKRAAAASAAHRERCVMNAPYPLAGPCASMALFAVAAARSGLAGRTGRAAAHRHVARAEQADVGLAVRIRPDIARPGDRAVARQRATQVGAVPPPARLVAPAPLRG